VNNSRKKGGVTGPESKGKRRGRKGGGVRGLGMKAEIARACRPRNGKREPRRNEKKGVGLPRGEKHGGKKKPAFRRGDNGGVSKGGTTIGGGGGKSCIYSYKGKRHRPRFGAKGKKKTNKLAKGRTGNFHTPYLTKNHRS